MKFNVVDCSHS